MIESRRMYQRRGDLASLQNIILADGEIGVVLDNNGLIFYGVNGQNRLILDANSVIDDLTVNQANLPLSARSGMILKGKIDSVENFITFYETKINDKVDGMEADVIKNKDDIATINISLTDLYNILETKQDFIVHKSNTPPTDTELMWLDTSV